MHKEQFHLFKINLFEIHLIYLKKIIILPNEKR